MMREHLSWLRTTLMLIFIALVIASLVYSRIMVYSLAPTIKPADQSRKGMVKVYDGNSL
jgi:uncharacterized membrane protein YidH (DUF202 family)